MSIRMHFYDCFNVYSILINEEKYQNLKQVKSCIVYEWKNLLNFQFTAFEILSFFRKKFSLILFTPRSIKIKIRSRSGKIKMRYNSYHALFQPELHQ